MAGGEFTGFSRKPHHFSIRPCILAPVTPRELIQPGDGWLDAPGPGRTARVGAVALAGLALYGLRGGSGGIR